MWKLALTLAATVTLLTLVLDEKTHQLHADAKDAASEPCCALSSPSVDDLVALVSGQVGRGQQAPPRRGQTPAPRGTNSSSGYAKWFQQESSGKYPSPFGMYIEEQEFKEGSWDASTSGSAQVATGGGELPFLSLTFAGPGTVDVLLPRTFQTPLSDGEIYGLYAYARVSANAQTPLKVSLIIKTDDTLHLIGAPETVMSASQRRAVTITRGNTRQALEGMGGKELDLSCKGQPFRLGLRFEPIDAKSAQIRLEHVGMGTVATCCPAGEPASQREPGQADPGRRQRSEPPPRQGRREQEAKQPTKKVCCDDTRANADVVVDRNGQITFDVKLPDGLDSDFQPYAEIVDVEAGDVTDLYGNIDTSTTTWIDSFPCLKSIGGLSEDQIQDLVLGDPGLRDDGYRPEEAKALGEIAASVEELLEKEQKQLDWDKEDAKDDADETMKKAFPSAPSGSPWIFERNSSNPNEWAFYPGADIVFVHGLKTNHIKDLLSIGFEGSKERWTEEAGYGSVKRRNEAVKTKWESDANPSAAAASKNPEFYSGYFKKGAEWYWQEGEEQVAEGHIPVFLRGGVSGQGHNPFVASKTSNKGYANRYLIVAYNCADGAKPAAKAVLRQIADAMRYQTGVVNPVNANVKDGFGSRGLVIVSHSTGGLVTNVAMQLAKRRSKWNIGWLPDYVKLHVAADSAISGSRLATVAIAAGYAADEGLKAGLASIGLEPTSTLSTANAALQLIGIPIPVGNFGNELRESILFDLVPTVAQARWGRMFLGLAIGGKKSFTASDPDDYVPPTLCVPGAHPTQYSPLKYSFILTGLDDGVTNMNSASGNPTITWRWPSGFLGHPTLNYDLGIALSNLTTKVKIGPVTIGVIGSGMGHAKRANRFYFDMKDVILTPSPLDTNPDKAALGAWFFAAGPDYRLSPVGMLQEYGSSDPYRQRVISRYPNMFTALAASSDHYDGTIGSGGGVRWSDYQISGSEKNSEETYVVTANDTDVYRPFLPPAISGVGSSNPLNRPVLSGPLPQTMRFRGLRLYVKFRGRVRSLWIVKRSYLNLMNDEGQMKFDYVYWNVLGGGR